MKSAWTFGQKLAGGFGVTLLLTLLMGYVGYYALNAVVAAKDQVITVTAQDLIDAEVIRALSHKTASAVRGFIITADNRFVDEQREASTTMKTAIETSRQRATDDASRRRLQAIETAASDFHREADAVLAMRRAATDTVQIEAAFQKQVLPRYDVFLEAVRAYVNDTRADLERGRALASDKAADAMGLLAVIGAGAFVAALLLAFILTQTLSRQIGGSVQHIRSSSAELQAAASQQASGAKEQATAMTEIGTTIGELLATSRQIALSAQRVARIAGESADGAREGGESVRAASEALQSIRQQVETIVQHMLDLGRKSQQIGGILEIINELAEQTNILAINATIEAAGAGESGRRFAVVGEEIRKLADRVGGSTKEIRGLIEEIRAAVNTTVMATETGSKTVEAGAQRFQALSSAFERIAGGVDTTTEAAREIELSTKQQATAVEQVNVAIANVAQATKESETGSNQTFQTASTLARLSNELARLVQAQEQAA